LISWNELAAAPGKTDDVGALCSGQAPARVTDEDDDGSVGLLDRDRMAQPVVLGNARRRDFAGRTGDIRTRAQHDGKAHERAQQAQGSMAIDR